MLDEAIMGGKGTAKGPWAAWVSGSLGGARWLLRFKGPLSHVDTMDSFAYLTGRGCDVRWARSLLSELVRRS